MAHDEPTDVNYGDFEFVNFRIGLQSEAPPDSTREEEYQIDTDVLDLENDELAMLTFLETSMSSHFGTTDENQEAGGGASVNVEIGANLAGSEFLGQGEDRGMSRIDTSSAINAFDLSAADEPGLWAVLNTAVTSHFEKSTADGTYGGQGNGDNDRMRRVYTEETMGGPYIDSTDDISVNVLIERRDSNSPLRAFIYGQMAFLIYEYENRRQEFAPYDPA